MIATRGSWLILATFGFALLLAAFPVPVGWRAYLPDWPMMVLFYWVLALPARVGVLSACVAGMATDILDGSPVGATAVGATLAVLALLVSYQRVRQFDGLQQSFVVGLLVAVVHLIEQRLETLLGWQHVGTAFLVPAITSMVFWLPVRNSLRALRRYYEVQ